MGKSSKYPKYTSGSVSVNGRTVATTRKNDDGTISSNYNMSKAEKNLYEGIQKNLGSSVQNLFKISPADKKAWNQQLNTYKQQGIAEINSIYTPMETNLKNDIASRFGNLDNSVFLDKLKDITDNKAKAVSNLSNNLVLQQNKLYSDEMQNRINYITLLSGLQTNMNNNLFSYINQARQNTESGNNYNSRSYQANSSSGGFFGLNSNQLLSAATNTLSFL